MGATFYTLPPRGTVSMLIVPLVATNVALKLYWLTFNWSPEVIIRPAGIIKRPTTIDHLVL